MHAKDDVGDTPLHEAAGHDARATAVELITRGADVHSKNVSEKTPLHAAVWYTAEEVNAKILVDLGFVHADDDSGETPLHQAAGYSARATVAELITRGADVHAKDDSGNTPLHLVAGRGSRETVAELIAHGADLHAKNDSGNAPLQLAAGRDFVAGDIHGCFRTLELALARVGFEPGRDRLFSAGDLVNRGPHSMEASEWLEDGRIEDAVLGNHEAMVLNTLLNGGGRVRTGWMSQLDGTRIERWIGALWRLPVAMTIATAHGDVEIAHAGIVDRNWHRTIEGIGSGIRRSSRPRSWEDTERTGAARRERQSRAYERSSPATSPCTRRSATGTGGRSTSGQGSQDSTA